MENWNPVEIAKRGAEWLDKEQPDWYRRINKKGIAMGSCARCIMGQTFSDKEEGLIFYGYQDRLGQEWIIQHGFDVPDRWDRRKFQQEQIIKAWVNEINLRLAKDEQKEEWLSEHLWAGCNESAMSETVPH